MAHTHGGDHAGHGPEDGQGGVPGGRFGGLFARVLSRQFLYLLGIELTAVAKVAGDAVRREFDAHGDE